MRQRYFAREEVAITNDLIELLEWQEGDDGNLVRDFFPIRVGSKNLIQLQQKMDYYDYSTKITFRPYKSAKHIAFITDYLYMEENINSVYTIKNDNGTYTGVIEMEEGNELIVENCLNNTHAEFCACCSYLFGDEIIEQIKRIDKFEAKTKEIMDKKKEEYESKQKSEKKGKKKNDK